jgi:hypothetical protein
MCPNQTAIFTARLLAAAYTFTHTGDENVLADWFKSSDRMVVSTVPTRPDVLISNQAHRSEELHRAGRFVSHRVLLAR